MRDEALWSAVIAQALEDCVMRIADPKPGASKSRLFELAARRRDRDDARRWLTEGGNDFIEVCGLAGLNPTRVQDFARAQMDQATPRDYEQPLPAVALLETEPA